METQRKPAHLPSVDTSVTSVTSDPGPADHQVDRAGTGGQGREDVWRSEGWRESDQNESLPSFSTQVFWVMKMTSDRRPKLWKHSEVWLRLSRDVLKRH